MRKRYYTKEESYIKHQKICKTLGIFLFSQIKVPNSIFSLLTHILRNKITQLLGRRVLCASWVAENRNVV